MVFAITNPKNMKKVDQIIHEEIAKFLKDGVSLSELNEGKKAYNEQQKVQRSNDRQLATQLAQGLLVGRTYQFYADLEKKIASLEGRLNNPGYLAKAPPKLVQETNDQLNAAREELKKLRG